MTCLILILGGAYYYRRRSKKVKYITATARTGDTIAAVQATGTINSLTRVAVGSYVPGTVKYIFADCNTRVSNGQVLAQLDPAIDIDKAQAVVASGNLQKARANLVTLAANVQVEQAILAKSQPNVKYQGPQPSDRSICFSQASFQPILTICRSRRSGRHELMFAPSRPTWNRRRRRICSSGRPKSPRTGW